jgi:hypothetical protein
VIFTEKARSLRFLRSVSSWRSRAVTALRLRLNAQCVVRKVFGRISGLSVYINDTSRLKALQPLRLVALIHDNEAQEFFPPSGRLIRQKCSCKVPAKLPAKKFKGSTRAVLHEFAGVNGKFANQRAKNTRRESPIPTLASKPKCFLHQGFGERQR